MQVTEKRYYTVEEYLGLEEKADSKSEYVDGEIIPMAGKSANHNQIALNFSTELNFAFSHNQIPKLFAYFEENGEFFLIQEFIEGQDLGKELTPGKQLSEGYTIKLLRDVLEVLAFVHKNNVIHRDIKPQNIMRPKPGGQLILIDFGAVKQVGTVLLNKPQGTSLTVSIGTPGYMPNEQAVGKPKLQSDIYAVGMTAIQALTGIPPYSLSEDNDGEVLWQDNVKVSNELASVITKMVRYDWRQRYADASDVLQALNTALYRPQPLINVALPSIPSALVLKKIKIGHKYGYIQYINNGGELVILPQFDYAENFSEGLAVIKQRGKYGYINTNGEIIVTPQFDTAKNFTERLALVQQKGKWGYINTNGEIIIPCQYSNAGSFSEGLAPVQKSYKKYGYINTNGKEIISANFDYAASFTEKLGLVKQKGKWGYISIDGVFVISPQFNDSYSFFDGMALFKGRDQWGYINNSGKQVIPALFDDTWGFSEGMALIQQKNKYGYINLKGKQVIPSLFDNAGHFNEGLAPVKLNGKWGYIDINSKFVIPPQFDFIEQYVDELMSRAFSNGLAQVDIDGQEHYIDKIGKVVY